MFFNLYSFKTFIINQFLLILNKQIFFSFLEFFLEIKQIRSFTLTKLIIIMCNSVSEQLPTRTIFPLIIFSRIIALWTIATPPPPPADYCLPDNWPRRQFPPSKIVLRINAPQTIAPGQLSRGQLSGWQFSSGAIVLEPYITLLTSGSL